MTSAFHDQRLNAVRYSGADSAAILAGACLVVALADLAGDSPAHRADALHWLSEGGTGAYWGELLGAQEVLADALADVADRGPTPYRRLMAR